jgi:hypothetical protein
MAVRRPCRKRRAGPALLVGHRRLPISRMQESERGALTPLIIIPESSLIGRRRMAAR